MILDVVNHACGVNFLFHGVLRESLSTNLITISIYHIQMTVEKNEIDNLVASGASNIVSLPYQPLALLRSTLESADVQVVVVGEDTVGIVHPCKIYSALYVGRPILLISPYECPAAEIVRALNAGWQIKQGDVTATKDTILKIYGLSADERQRFGEQGAAGVRQHYSRERLLGLLTSFISNDV